MNRKRTVRRVAAATVLAAAASVSAGCGLEAGAGIVRIDLFQFKGEAAEDFTAMVAQFERENPDIDVVLNNSPDADNEIRTLLVKGKAPDVITLNGAGTFAQLARAGVFHDFTGDPLLERINPAVQQILADLGTFHGTEANSLGYVNNADGILYNRDLFAAQGIAVPRTWEELIAVCEKLQAAGIAPFVSTLASGWTGLPSFNGLGAYAAQDGFFEDLRAQGALVGPDSAASFTKDFREVLDKQAALFAYSQDGYRGALYDKGAAAFAAGQGAMMLQGIWAMAPVLMANPDFHAGMFPYPGGSPDESVVVSGVDLTVTIARDTDHFDQAHRLVEFLFRQDIISAYAASQNMIPSVIGATVPADPVIQDAMAYFDSGRIAGFTDHQVPQSIPLEQIVQGFLLDGDAAKALATLDNEWSKVARRATTRR